MDKISNSLKKCTELNSFIFNSNHEKGKLVIWLINYHILMQITCEHMHEYELTAAIYIFENMIKIIINVPLKSENINYFKKIK